MIQVETSKILKVTSDESKIALTVDTDHRYLAINHKPDRDRRVQLSDIRTSADLDDILPKSPGFVLSCSPILALQNLRKMVDLALAELTKELTTNQQLHPEGTDD